MDDDLVRRIAAHPSYKALKARRTRLGSTLTGLMLVVYFGFILLVAFDKPLLARRIGAGVTTIGMPIGLGVILFTVAITAYYVLRANAEFDALTDAVVRDTRATAPQPSPSVGTRLAKPAAGRKVYP